MTFAHSARRTITAPPTAVSWIVSGKKGATGRPATASGPTRSARRVMLAAISNDEGGAFDSRARAVYPRLSGRASKARNF